jgi:hypothetical protein
MKEFNGHRSWNAWNVSLWLFNDESFYGVLVEASERFKNPRLQARFILGQLPARTPDGARFNRLCVLKALKELKE